MRKEAQEMLCLATNIDHDNIETCLIDLWGRIHQIAPFSAMDACWVAYSRRLGLIENASLFDILRSPIYSLSVRWKKMNRVDRFEIGKQFVEAVTTGKTGFVLDDESTIIISNVCQSRLA